MPQISPIYWTLIILTLTTFILVISSNITNTNSAINANNEVKLTNNTINW